MLTYDFAAPKRKFLIIQLCSEKKKLPVGVPFPGANMSVSGARNLLRPDTCTCRSSNQVVLTTTLRRAYIASDWRWPFENEQRSCHVSCPHHTLRHENLLQARQGRHPGRNGRPPVPSELRATRTRHEKQKAYIAIYAPRKITRISRWRGGNSVRL